MRGTSHLSDFHNSNICYRVVWWFVPLLTFIFAANSVNIVKSKQISFYFVKCNILRVKDKSNSTPHIDRPLIFLSNIYYKEYSTPACFLIWAGTWDFQQCGICDQQSLRSACAYAQSDQSLCLSLEYYMNIKLLNEHNFEFLSLNGGFTGLSESIYVKMPHCWKSHVPAHL